MAGQRQLAAIMFTDIEGYTALMQNDEKETVAIRNRHREVFNSITELHNGTIVQYFGDGTLSTFKSTVEAVNCGIALQTAFLEDPQIPVRIGIHVGDIIQTEDDIIGDAVNVASRIESCAIAGSILISDKVNDQIRSHRHLEAKYLGVFDLKNIDEALPIFAITNDSLNIPDANDIKTRLSQNSKSIEKPKFGLKTIFGLVLILCAVFFGTYYYFNNQGKPISLDNSIAVLPFENLSTDDDAEIFRDGVTEDILTQLSKLKELHVISRKSIMQFKQTDKPIAEIAEKLGVSYVLQGGIRKYGDKIRVTAQLIQAESDEQIWTGQYDKTIIDVFAIQSEISKEIVDKHKLC